MVLKYRYLRFKLFFCILISTPQLWAEIHWQQIGPGAGGVTTTIEFDPFNKRRVYMASDVAGIFRSDDLGKTWKTLMGPMLDINAPHGVIYVHNIAFDPLKKNVVFILTTAGLFRSTDCGESWKVVIKNKYVHSNLTFSPFNPKHVLCGSGQFIRASGTGEVFKSIDGGVTWKSLERKKLQLPSSAAVRSIAYAPWKEDLVYAGTSDGMYKSLDGGLSWKKMKVFAPGKNLDIYSLKVVKYKKRKSMFIVARDVDLKCGEIYRSFNAGKTWVNLTDKLLKYNSVTTRRNAYHLVYSKKTGSLYLPIFLGWDRWRGVWKGSQFGEKWTRITTEKNIKKAYWGGAFADCVAVSPHNPKIMFFGNSQEAYRSTNGGKTWVNCTSKRLSKMSYKSTGYDNTYSFGLAFDPKRPKKAVAYYQDVGKWYYNYKTDVFTRTASVQNNKVDGYHGCIHNVIFDKSFKKHYFLSAGTGVNEMVLRRPSDYLPHGKVVKVHRSKNKEVYEVLGKNELPNSDALLAVDFSKPPKRRHLYAAFVDRGIYRSKNGGSNFKRVAEKINGSAFFYKIYCYGKDKPGVYVITSLDRITGEDPGLYRSLDEGETWESFFDIKRFGAPFSIIQHPQDEKTFYVGTAYNLVPSNYQASIDGGGVYKTEDDGKTWVRILNQPFVSALAIDLKNPKRILAASSLYAADRSPLEIRAGVYYTIDGGKTWSREKKGLGGQIFTFVAFNPFDEKLFYVGTLGAGLHKGKYIGN